MVNARRRMPAAAASRSMSSIDLGIGHRLAIVVVAVPARCRSSVRGVPSRTAGRRRAACAAPGSLNWLQLLPHAPGDVEPGHVVHGEDAHRHAEVGERVDPPAPASRLPRRGTAPRTCTGTSCGCRRSPGRCRRPRRPCRAAWRTPARWRASRALVAVPRTISTSRITLRRAEEVQADDRCRPRRRGGDRVDVERRRVGGEHAAGPAPTRSSAANTSCLSAMFSNTASMIRSAVVEAVVADLRADPRRGARRPSLGREAPALHRDVVVLADRGHAAVERLLRRRR